MRLVFGRRSSAPPHCSTFAVLVVFLLQHACASLSALLLSSTLLLNTIRASRSTFSHGPFFEISTRSWTPQASVGCQVESTIRFALSKMSYSHLHPLLKLYATVFKLVEQMMSWSNIWREGTATRRCWSGTISCLAGSSHTRIHCHYKCPSLSVWLWWNLYLCILVIGRRLESIGWFSFRLIGVVE